MPLERNTHQRQAILAVINASSEPLTPPQILALASRQSPRLGIATVYRLIRLLLSENMIAMVEIPGQPPRYERQSPGHHHHFLCEKCSHVFDLGTCLPNINSIAPPHFKVARHDLTLYGECASCAQSHSVPRT